MAASFFKMCCIYAPQDTFAVTWEALLCGLWMVSIENSVTICSISPSLLQAIALGQHTSFPSLHWQTEALAFHAENITLQLNLSSAFYMFTFTARRTSGNIRRPTQSTQI